MKFLLILLFLIGAVFAFISGLSLIVGILFVFCIALFKIMVDILPILAIFIVAVAVMIICSFLYDLF